MCKVSFGHEVVCLDYSFKVGAVDTHSDTHYHVLGTLGNTTVEAKEVRSFKGLETEAEKVLTIAGMEKDAKHTSYS